MSFVQGEDRTFRFGVNRIGSSLFLVRRTNEPGELIENVRGYGHTFPEAYTQWDQSVKASASHQRIVKYDFAGLKCFVRSECDGFLPAKIDNCTGTGDASDDANDNSLANNGPPLAALTLGLQQDPSSLGELVIRRAGGFVPQQALFDLKTRARRAGHDPEFVTGFLQRLWVNQTPNMILAYHTRGRFEHDDIHVIDVRVKVQEWENEHAPALSQLGGILHKLIEFSQREATRYFEARRVGAGPLELWSESTSWSALPHTLHHKLGMTLVTDPCVGSSQDSSSEENCSEDDVDYLKFNF